MKAGWKVFWLSVVVLAISFGAERLLVPDVVPVGYADEPQPPWAVLTAFALRSIELTADGWRRSRWRCCWLVDQGSLAWPKGYAASHATGRLSRPRNAQPPILTFSDGSSRSSFIRANSEGSATSATIAREAKAPAQ